MRYLIEFDVIIIISRISLILGLLTPNTIHTATIVEYLRPLFEGKTQPKLMIRSSPTKLSRNSLYRHLYNLWFGREFLRNKEEEFLLSKYDNEVHALSLRNKVIQDTNLFFEKGRFDDFLELDIFQEYYFEYLTFSRNINIASTSHQFRPSNFLADLYVLYIETGLIDEYLTQRCSKKHLVSFGAPTATCDYFRL